MTLKHTVETILTIWVNFYCVCDKCRGIQPYIEINFDTTGRLLTIFPDTSFICKSGKKYYIDEKLIKHLASLGATQESIIRAIYENINNEKN